MKWTQDKTVLLVLSWIDREQGKTTGGNWLITFFPITTIIYVLLHTKTTVNVFLFNRGRPDDTGG